MLALRIEKIGELAVVELFNPTRSVRDRLELVNSIAELDIATLHEMMELLANADGRYAMAA